MTTVDFNDMQRYLVEEEVEKWQEGSLTRRDFMRRVGLIVGGAAAANSVLLSMGCDPNTPQGNPTATSTSPAATATSSNLPLTPSGAGGGGDFTPTPDNPYNVAENNPGVKAEMVDIPSSDASVKLKGYLATPTNAGSDQRPGVLVIHENRGLTEHIKDVVRRLAKANYVALGVDLISRQGGSDAHPDESERIGILGNLQPEDAISDLSAGLDYLRSRNDVDPERLGVTGFCFGGGYTWRIATKRVDLKAAVPFYGPNPPLEDVPNIKAAVLGIYGGLDTRITGQVPQLEEALKKANVTYEIKIYEGAEHAFHNDTGPRYKPDAAKDAWDRTLAWFGKYLQG